MDEEQQLDAMINESRLIVRLYKEVRERSRSDSAYEREFYGHLLAYMRQNVANLNEPELRRLEETTINFRKHIEDMGRFNPYLDVVIERCKIEFELMG
jgi:hypothetical protein